MKRILLSVATAMFAMSMGAIAQNQGGPGPRAFGDRDKDGKCDITGQPVGQGRGRGMAAMQRGGGGGGCRGRAQQNACCRRGQGPAAQTTPTPPQQKK